MSELINALTEPNRAAIRALTLGINAITVGVKGMYSTIDAALAFIATQPLMTQVDVGAMTMTLTQYSNVAVASINPYTAGARVGDMMKVTTDKGATPPGAQATHYYPIIGVDVPAGGRNVVLAHSIIGAAKAGFAATFWRPVRYQILLAAGETHAPAVNTQIPEGCNLTISGYGPSSPIDASGYITLLAPTYGYLTLDNLVSLHGPLMTAPGTMTSFPNVEQGLAMLRIRNNTWHCEDSLIWAGGLGCSALFASDFDVLDAGDHGMICVADWIDIRNFSMTANRWWETLVLRGATYWENISHPKNIRNFTYKRRGTSATDGTGPQDGIQVNSSNLLGLSGLYRANFDNLWIVDESVNVAVNAISVTGDGGAAGIGGVEVTLRNGIIDHTSGTYGVDVKSVDNFAFIYMENVRKLDKTNPTTSATIAGNIKIANTAYV